jgi:hypothetical protein
MDETRITETNPCLIRVHPWLNILGFRIGADHFFWHSPLPFASLKGNPTKPPIPDHKE